MILTNSNKNAILLGSEKIADFLLPKTRVQSRLRKSNRFLLTAEMHPFLLEVDMTKIEKANYLKQYFAKRHWVRTYGSCQTRCNNKGNKNYIYYGERGIKLLMTTQDFKYLWFRDKAYLMKRPTIDRINNDGNYELKNCRYLESRDNVRRNSNSKLTVSKAKEIKKLLKNSSTPIKEIALLFGVKPVTIYDIKEGRRWKEVLP